MARPKRVAHTPTERLAQVLRLAYIAAYVRDNPLHDAPEWDEVKGLGRTGGWLAVARELEARGVRAPLGEIASGGGKG